MCKIFGAARDDAGERLYDVRVCTPGALAVSSTAGFQVVAGLLDGRPATTHWAHADSFRRLFPSTGRGTCWRRPT